MEHTVLFWICERFTAALVKALLRHCSLSSLASKSYVTTIILAATQVAECFARLETLFH